jgi:hypothetical protein
MTFFVFTPLAFIVLSLSVKWPWKRIVLVAVGIGLAADIYFDAMVKR